MGALLRVFTTPQLDDYKWLRRVLVLAGCLVLLTACSSGLDEIDGSLRAVGSVLRVIMTIVGFLLLVAGFSLYEFILQLMGFIAGGIFGALLGALLSGGSDSAAILPVIIGFLVCGIIGAWLAAFLSCLSVFLSGFFIGAIALAAIFGGLSEKVPDAWVWILGGIIGGLVMLALYRFWVTALTAAIGAVLFGAGIQAPPWMWFFFFLIGMACQYGLAKASGNEHKVKPGYTRPVAPVLSAAAALPQAFPPAVSPLPGGPYPPAAHMPQAPAPPSAGLSAGEKFCPYCGKKIRAQARFCPGCGRAQ